MTKKRKNRIALGKRCSHCKHNATCIRESKEVMRCINKNHARYEEKEEHPRCANCKRFRAAGLPPDCLRRFVQ